MICNKLVWEIRDVEVCRIDRAIFVGEADDILRLGAKPEMCALLRPSTRHRSTPYVREHFELFEKIKPLLLPCLLSLMQR